MTGLNTNLDDLSDVTDEAIEVALQLPGPISATAEDVRSCPSVWDTTILLARCIQAHYPEMIVDPVIAKAREFFAERHKAGAHDLMVGGMVRSQDAAEEYILAGDFDNHWAMLLIVAAMRRALEGSANEQGDRRMMTGQEAAATPNGLYADSLPPRTFNPDDLLTEVSKVERATLEEKRNKRAYIAEAHARLGAVLGECDE